MLYWPVFHDSYNAALGGQFAAEVRIHQAISGKSVWEHNTRKFIFVFIPCREEGSIPHGGYVGTAWEGSETEPSSFKYM